MQNIENTLKTRIQNDRAGSFVVIVPTDAARVKRQRELVGYHQNKAVTNLRVLDIENFVQRLYNRVRPARKHISQGIQNLWLHEIANNSDNHRYEEFRPTENIPVPDSTLSLIADTINRLKERGETSENIAADNPTQSDLVRLYNDYETKLEDGWIDEHGKRLYLANNFDPEFMASAFPSVKLVVVEGFTVLSETNTKILTRIAEMSDIEMWFRTDYVPENQTLYKDIGDLVSQFTDAKATIDPNYERAPERHKHFAENLFQTENGDANSVAAPKTTSEIKMLRPVDRSDEVEQIASLIQKRISEGHCQLSDICVAYYNIGQYQQRIAETFPTYGIRYSLAQNAPITKSEVVKSIFSHLSSDRPTIGNAYFSEVEPASDASRFHPNEFQAYVDKLLKKGEVAQRILNPMLGENSGIVEGEVEAYRLFKRIVKELCSVLRAESEKLYPLSEYIDKLLRIARRTNYRNRPATQGESVKIVQLGELRSMEFDTVFLGDFVESRFPENYRPDPLLPEVPYRDEEELLRDNRFLFYRVLKSFRERLYLVVPQREREAELIPSPFLGELKAIVDVETIKVANPQRGSVPGFLSTYGNHIWTTATASDRAFPDNLTDMRPTPSDRAFPDNLADMRPLIDHVIAVEKSREETHDCLGYEGVLTAGMLSTQSRERLERRRRWTYSVTELETYAKCPFQYFVSEVLKFRAEEDDAEDELSNRDKGSLLHEVLFEFYDNRREGPPIEQCFEEAKRQLDGILDTKSEERRTQRSENLIGDDNLFWEADIEKLRVALYKWLEAERTCDLSVTPSYFEVSFGQKREPRDSKLSCPTSIRIGDVGMTGKIDRIDIGNSAFNVIDYKTGSSTVRMPEILSGRSLQLPIYLQIAKKLLDDNGITDLEAASGLYHKIRLDKCTVELGIGTEFLNGEAFKNYNGTDWKSVSSRSGQLLEDEYFAEMLERVSGYAQQYVDSISNGDFPLITRVETFVDSEAEGDAPITPRNKTAPCSYCDYKRICRVGAISETPQSDD